jgi:hypothetical protein
MSISIVPPRRIMAPGTLMYLPCTSDLNDLSGFHHDGTWSSGSPTFTTIDGYQCVTGFINSGGSGIDVNGSRLVSYMSSSTKYTIEWYEYQNDINPVYHAGFSADSTDFVFSLWDKAYAKQLWYENPYVLPLQTLNGSQLSGGWHHIAYVGDGTSRYIYIDNTLSASGGPYASFPTTTNLRFGTIQTNTSVYVTDGYMRDIRISNIARTTFPTTDLIV